MLMRGWSRDILFGALFVAFAFLSLKSSSDELPHWLRGTGVAPWFSQFTTGNQSIHDIAVGVIVSLFIYFLVVRLPESDKRRRVRRGLQGHYASFRRGCVQVFLEAMKQGYDPALIDGLCDRDEFGRFFREPFSPGQTRWDAVANGLDPEGVNGLIIEFDIFRAEIRYALVVVDVESQEITGFLSRLAGSLYRARSYSCEYDSVKSLLRLMWSVFTGWDPVDGQSDKDVIADAIAAM
jgi:hypothetical protein